MHVHCGTRGSEVFELTRVERRVTIGYFFQVTLNFVVQIFKMLIIAEREVSWEEKCS